MLSMENKNRGKLYFYLEELKANDVIVRSSHAAVSAQVLLL